MTERHTTSFDPNNEETPSIPSTNDMGIPSSWDTDTKSTTGHGHNTIPCDHFGCPWDGCIQESTDSTNTIEEVEATAKATDKRDNQQKDKSEDFWALPQRTRFTRVIEISPHAGGDSGFNVGLIGSLHFRKMWKTMM